MKKFKCFTILLLFIQINQNAQQSIISPVIEKKGWLVYYLDHAIWFESNIAGILPCKSFFKKSKYENGLIVDYLDDAKKIKSKAKRYSIRTLTNFENRDKPSYSETQTISIIPVVVEFEYKKDESFSDMVGVSFKKNRNEVTMEYWFLTNYSVSKIQVLSKK